MTTGTKLTLADYLNAGYRGVRRVSEGWARVVGPRAERVYVYRTRAEARDGSIGDTNFIASAHL